MNLYFFIFFYNLDKLMVAIIFILYFIN